MRVFVAGGTGAIGRRLVRLLTAEGHQVVATTRHADKAATLEAVGAVPVVVDALDREAVLEAVLEAEPDVVVHQLTALSGGGSLRRFDGQFAATNRLRTQGTDHLLEAARAAGARRFVAQSYAGWPYAREGGPIKSEGAPFDPGPPRHMRRSLDAIRHLEDAVLGAPDIDGVVLRYGTFYGPGTGIAEDGDLVQLVRRRRLPVIGSGAGVWSFVHVDDAAEATAAAIRLGAPAGVFNVVDDDPAPVREWLPELAAAVGAEPPRRVPIALGRLFTGDVGVSLMTRVRGASNAKARDELGWRPRYESWRSGFRRGLGRVDNDGQRRPVHLHHAEGQSLPPS
ncbi:MAG TPA: NAD(P)-dependent oxidoreductase [Acidimicrobiales bacterium]|nr:NAD(P)-dependent oxidoreductase [Acidimicrobiales bacterium]